MATLRERMIGVVERCRSFNDVRLGLRRYTLYLRRRTAIGGNDGMSAEWHTSDQLVDEKFRVRAANSRDIAESAGRIQSGDMMLDRITPRNDADTAGNWLDELDMKPSTKKEKVFWVLVGPGYATYSDVEPPSGGKPHTLVWFDVTGNFEWKMALRPCTGV